MRVKKEKKGATAPVPVTISEGQQCIQQFEQEIKRQDDILYGVALFFEGLTVLREGEGAEMDAQRALFQDIIQTGRAQIDQATALLEQVRKTPTHARLLTEFVFSPCQGHPQAQELVTRARILVRLYAEMFGERPRSQAFTESEIFKLMEAVAEKLA